MTENDDGDRSDAPTMADVDHTHPHTNRSFGGNFTFARGGVVAADGGRPDVVPEERAGPTGETDGSPAPGTSGGPGTLKDVDHTPPNGSEDANRVFSRGGEHGPV